MLILGIESSCDETAAAVLADGSTLLSNVIDSQIETHSKFGGVVPELASRQHLTAIYPVVQEALQQAGIPLGRIQALAVTRGPGLIGSLLVGLSFAKALSLVSNIPCVGVDHMAGHLASVFLADEKPSFPYVALIASGGHSSLFEVRDHLHYTLLGRTRDDAAGEAFDKVAKLMGLGYPGGPIICRLATGGNGEAIAFPRAWLTPDSLDFSFSGLKTAVANHVNRARQHGEELHIPDICASFQEAVVEVLVKKTVGAALSRAIKTIVMVGGVAANPRLREVMQLCGRQAGLRVYMPPIDFCTDNAAMIALAGYHRFKGDNADPLDMDVYSRSPIS